jgi:glycine/D-amino acid oxidase-like deaminating enzyme
VVVGGGVVGCATAYGLARKGAAVTLLERSELAAGASGRNHGLLLSPLDPVMVPMATETAAAYDEIGDVAPIPIRWTLAPSVTWNPPWRVTWWRDGSSMTRGGSIRRR